MFFSAFNSQKYLEISQYILLLSSRLILQLILQPIGNFPGILFLDVIIFLKETNHLIHKVVFVLDLRNLVEIQKALVVVCVGQPPDDGSLQLAMQLIQELHELLMRPLFLLESLTEELYEVRDLGLCQLLVIQFSDCKISEIFKCLGQIGLAGVQITKGVTHDVLHFSFDAVNLFVVNLQGFFMDGQKYIFRLVQERLRAAYPRILLAKLSGRGGLAVRLLLALHITIGLQNGVGQLAISPLAELLVSVGVFVHISTVHQGAESVSAYLVCSPKKFTL